MHEILQHSLVIDHLYFTLQPDGTGLSKEVNDRAHFYKEIIRNLMSGCITPPQR